MGDDLKDLCVCGPDPMEDSDVPVAEKCAPCEAADRIAELEAEVERLRHDLSRQMEIAQAETERAERLQRAFSEIKSAARGKIPSGLHLLIERWDSTLSEKGDKDADKG